MPSPESPVAIAVGGIEIRWYALFILLGVVGGTLLVRWLAARRGFDAEFPLDVAPWVIVAGIAGARLYYIALRADYFLANPGELVGLQLRGLSIHGAIVGGVLMFAYQCRRHRQPFFRWADAVVPGLALGQALGRWGNWANQEAFGGPTTLPWGLAIDPPFRPPAYAAFEQFHPTFLYESLFDLANAAFLAWLALRIPRSSRLREGDGLALYLILYGFARFVIEQLRTDSLYVGPFPAALWVSVALVGTGIALLIYARAGRSIRDDTVRAS